MAQNLDRFHPGDRRRHAGHAHRVTQARYAEVFATLEDWETFCSSSGVGLSNFAKEKPYRTPSIALEADPPLQTRTHRILARSCARQRCARCGRPSNATPKRSSNTSLEKRQFDAVADAARAYPLKVFPDAVGVPPGGRDALLAYGDMVFYFFGPENALLQDALSSAPEASKAVMALCEREALTPGGIGALIFEAHDAGEVTYQEAEMLVRSLLSAGLATTINALGFALVSFARRRSFESRDRRAPRHCGTHGRISHQRNFRAPRCREPR